MTHSPLTSVRVYWNRHKRVWSVRRRGERVQHYRAMTLGRARFKVYERARRRAIDKGVRNVHAFCDGEFIGAPEPEFVARLGLPEVGYNPFRNPDRPGRFYVKESGAPVLGALILVLTEDGRVFACEPQLEPKP